MSDQDLFKIHLPKWTTVFIKGEQITPTQAEEIILRTNSLCFDFSPKELMREVYELLYNVKFNTENTPGRLISGVGSSDSNARQQRNLREAICRKINIDDSDFFSVEQIEKIIDYKKEQTDKFDHIPLKHFSNYMITEYQGKRVGHMGSYKGWCSSDGKIFSDSGYIGKWPTVQGVYEDWVLIAKNFPFLNLKLQLVYTICQLTGRKVDPKPLIDFTINNGEVEMKTPTEILEVDNHKKKCLEDYKQTYFNYTRNKKLLNLI